MVFKILILTLLIGLAIAVSPYLVLELEENAPQSQVQAQYKKMIKKMEKYRERSKEKITL